MNTNPPSDNPMNSVENPNPLSSQSSGEQRPGKDNAVSAKQPPTSPSRLPSSQSNGEGILISTFSGLKDNIPQNHSVTWEQLLKKLCGAHKVEKALPDGKQASGALWSPTQYDDSQKRGSDHVEAITVLVADLDHISKVQVDQIQEDLRQRGLAFGVHSTFRHTSITPRFRMVIPLTTAIPSDQWNAAWETANRILFLGLLDRATKDLGRMYFWPATPANRKEEAISLCNSGQPLDLLGMVKVETSQSPQQQNPTTSGQAPSTPHQNRPARPQHRSEQQPTSIRFKDSPRPMNGSLTQTLSSPPTASGSPSDDLLRSELGARLLDKYISQAVIGNRNSMAFELACQLRDNKFSPTEALQYLSSFKVSMGPDFNDDMNHIWNQVNKKPSRDAWKNAKYRSSQNAERGFIRIPQKKSLNLESQDIKTDTNQSISDEKITYENIDFENYHKTDVGNTEMLIQLHGKNLFYVPGLGWRVWNGKYWQDSKERVLELARFTIRSLFARATQLDQRAQASKVPDEKAFLKSQADALRRHAHRSEAVSRLNAMVELAASFSSITVDAECFNTQAWRIGFQNGNWYQGDWHGHRREDFIDELLPVSYDPNADQREWLAVLSRITGSDEDFARTLQDVTAYILSGASHLRKLIWAYGPQGTGKGTFAELLGTVLGNSSRVLDWSLLTSDREAEHLGRAVRNTRLLILQEAGYKRLSSEILKSLSGGDRIAGRFLYQSKWFNASPTWAMLAISNDPPVVNAYDLALRERVMALPFVHALDEGGPLPLTGHTRLEAARKDPSSALVTGFVAWAMEGLNRFYTTDQIHRASIVSAHTQRFWQDTDPLTEFWESIAPSHLSSGITRKDLRDKYEGWCDLEGVKAISPARLCDGARAFGLVDTKMGNGSVRGWKLEPRRETRTDSSKIRPQDTPDTLDTHF